MDSLVLELQRDALDRTVPISDLLREALVVANKLKTEEFETWITNELNGYDEDFPEYRILEGEIKGWNRFRGWLPIVFPDPEKHDQLTRRPCAIGIPEIEDLLERSTKDDTFDMSYGAKIEDLLRKAIHHDIKITFFIERASLVKIIETVRTRILSWTLKLEQGEVLGDELSSSGDEERAADSSEELDGKIIVHGNVGTLQFQQGTHASIQVVSTEQLDLNVVREFLAALREILEDPKLDEDIKQELEGDAQTVESQIDSQNLKESVVKRRLASIKGILRDIAIPATAQLLAQYGPVLLDKIS